MMGAMRAAAVIALLLSACAFNLPGGNNPTDGPPKDMGGDTPIDMPTDTPVDMPVDMTPPNLCFGTFSTVCLEALPTSMLTLSARINTDASPLCLPTTTNPDNACVVAGTSVLVTGVVPTDGSRPLIVLATTGAISIDGILDAASHRAGSTGPAANSSVCGTPSTP